MSRTTDIINVRIDRTHLGPEDHGIFTFMLHWSSDGTGGGFGGLCCGPNGLTDCLKLILKTLEVGSWEKLSGQFMRIKSEGLGGRTTHIGHLIKNQWVSIDDLAKLMKDSP